MKIRINKLFGKYDNVIDFDNKCTIYIGENGIGKSTSVKIINALLSFNYVGLLKYYFESIDIEDGSNILTLKYNDFALTTDYLVKDYCADDYELYDELKKEFLLLKKEYPTLIPEDIPMDAYNDARECDILCINYRFDTFCSMIDSYLLCKILKFDEHLLLNEKRLIDDVDAPYYLECIKSSYSSAERNLDDGIYYVNSEIANKHKLVKEMLLKINYKEVILINLASDFSVTNNFNRKYGFNECEDDAKSEKFKSVLEHNSKIDSSDLLHQKTFIGNLLQKYSGYSDLNVINTLKNAYKVVREVGYENNKIDFGFFLFNKLFSDELINSFKEDFYDFLYRNFNNYVSRTYKLTDSSFCKLKYKFGPLVPNENVLNCFFEGTSFNSYHINDILFGEEIGLCVDFYKEYKDKYFDIKDERLEKLNKLFSKYFKNKEVIATPFGISISSKDMLNDIYFEELSAGEQKIIILFTLALFSEDLVIILDEPETSLSVVWQEQLLPDIIENVKLSNLIIATQSPYVIENEMLDEYIIPLIDGDINE